MTLAEQQKFAILDLRQEVSSGGFDAYLRYWGGDTAELAVAALPVVLGPEWEELLVEAMRLMGPTYPLDPDARSRVIDENDLQATLHALDTRYYDLEAAVDADAAMCAYYG